MIQRGCRCRNASGLDILGGEDARSLAGVVGECAGAPGLRWRRDMVGDVGGGACVRCSGRKGGAARAEKCFGGAGH